MRIFVDADACPVTDLIINEAKSFNIQVTLVKSYNHFSLQNYPDHVKVTYVDTGADAADYKIIGMVKPNDLIITQDYGLAALGLEKGCYVLHHVGFFYSKQRIDQMLEERHRNAKARKAGYRTKGPKKLEDSQKENFRKTLRKFLIKD
ncbi:hypothetical protein SAMN04487944_101259 [Gracilibacillus ureilyticus]|uniref:UPF0178 protein SAMN04487944_101259 n=1 Tax=Gracilibacillus ureilyticus TaxID=531814 RepID=A0A1H9LHR4_9BACI|nr:YaiI/YqxD family protein [Gracilibacillus ureilyticus]SER10934.1 hypothetical protein SAMN04487944_101259 [Gracilibacillus ureilyticus]